MLPARPGGVIKRVQPNKDSHASFPKLKASDVKIPQLFQKRPDPGDLLLAVKCPNYKRNEKARERRKAF